MIPLSHRGPLGPVRSVWQCIYVQRTCPLAALSYFLRIVFAVFGTFWASTFGQKMCSPGPITARRVWGRDHRWDLWSCHRFIKLQFDRVRDWAAHSAFSLNLSPFVLFPDPLPLPSIPLTLICLCQCRQGGVSFQYGYILCVGFSFTSWAPVAVQHMFKS